MSQATLNASSHGERMFVNSCITVIETMRSHTLGIIAQLTYGHKVNSFDDEYFLLGEKFMEIAGDAVTPSLLDVHPLCEDSF